MSVLEEAAEALEAGSIVGMPTDTVYGLGVDPWNESAVESLYFFAWQVPASRSKT